MPRANRHFLPDHVWHNTHGCHQKDFLCWSEAIAVGSPAFVDKVKVELGLKALHREVADIGATYTLRKPRAAYARDFGSENDALKPNNTVPWEKNLDIAET